MLPKEMSSNNPILGHGPLANQIQVNCGGVAGKNAMWWAIFFKISKYLLLQRNIFNNSLLQEPNTNN